MSAEGERRKHTERRAIRATPLLRVIAVASACLAGGSCARPALERPSESDASPTAQSGAQDLEIAFDVGPCYGPCAVYRVVLKGDGTLDYEGKAFVAVVGHRSARVPPGDVAGLAAEFDVAGFDRLSWRVNCPERFVTDHGSVRMTLRRGDRSHAVDHNLGDGCAPPALARLESRVMNVIEPAIGDWIRCDGPCPNLP